MKTGSTNTPSIRKSHTLFERYYTPTELTQLHLSKNAIFGVPAAGTTSTSKQNVNNHKGSFGEAIIGNILNLIAIETPGLHVCHSVHMPEGHEGETDHVIIYKNKIILVETKAFSSYNAFSVSRDGFLKAGRAGERKRSVPDSNAFKKVAFYQERFPNRHVQSILAITRDRITTFSENGKYKVASLDNIMTMIRDEIDEAENIKEPSWPAVKFFASLCQAPKVTDQFVSIKADEPTIVEETIHTHRYSRYYTNKQGRSAHSR